MTAPSTPSIPATESQVANRISELAEIIIEQYADKNPLFVCLLRGGAPFATQLMFAITAKDPSFHPELDYMTVKTYGNKRIDSQPELLADILPSTQANERQVILLDDVLDKGGTAAFAHQYMIERHRAADVAMVVLVQKDIPRELYPEATLWGFTAPADWLTGMGMDDTRIAKEANRWSQAITLADANS